MKHFRPRSRALLALLVALIIMVPSTAFAGVSEYQVQFAPVGTTGNMQFIVNVILSATTKLPARVRVPLPEGATVLWAGEVLGGSVDDDPSRATSITPVPGGQIVEFTVESTRVAQVEADWTAPTISGKKVTASVKWPNTTDAGPYAISVRLESGASDVKITPTAEAIPERNAAGESLYVLAPVRLEKGATFPITVSYTRVDTTIGKKAGLSPFLIAALVLLGLAIAALIVVLVRQHRATLPPRDSATQGAPAGRAPRDAEPSLSDATAPDDDETFTWD